MALSKPESTKKCSNLACIARIILRPCTEALQNVLTKEITPQNLKKKFKKKYPLRFPGHLRYNVWFELQKSFLDFNIPMLYLCLRCICSISQHANGWGNCPEENDRSLSANIERIYSIEWEYRHFRKKFLTDAVFERECTKLFQIVKELEDYLQSGTEYQDYLKRLTICSIDPQVGKNYVKKLRGEFFFIQ